MKSLEEILALKVAKGDLPAHLEKEQGYLRKKQVDLAAVQAAAVARSADHAAIMAWGIVE